MNDECTLDDDSDEYDYETCLIISKRRRKMQSVSGAGPTMKAMRTRGLVAGLFRECHA
jgi:hypothetical protein